LRDGALLAMRRGHARRGDPTGVSCPRARGRTALATSPMIRGSMLVDFRDVL
jgi:hypothetical protein